MNGFTVDRIPYSECKEWLLYKHYAHRIPSISYAFGLFENGILKGNPGTVSNEMNQQMQGFLKSMQKSNTKQKSGCLGVIILFIVFSSSLLFGLKHIL